MNLIELDNITTTLECDLPKKKIIKPKNKCSTWSEDKSVLLVSILLNDKEFFSINDIKKLHIGNIYKLDEYLWLDLNHLYLILPVFDTLDHILQHSKTVLLFIHDKKIQHTIHLTN